MPQEAAGPFNLSDRSRSNESLANVSVNSKRAIAITGWKLTGYGRPFCGGLRIMAAQEMEWLFQEQWRDNVALVNIGILERWTRE